MVGGGGGVDRHSHLFQCGRNHTGSISPHREGCSDGNSACVMSVVAISFPETVILRQVLKPRLILVFNGVVAEDHLRRIPFQCADLIVCGCLRARTQARRKR